MLLHPRKGRNTRKLVCPRCSKSSGEIALGCKEFAAICQSCKSFNIGLDVNTSKCPSCFAQGLKPEFVPEEMALPKMCDSCLEEMAAQRAVLERGGILWQCEVCGNTGTLGGNHQMAKDVREKTGVKPPDACIAILDETTCPVCLKKDPENDPENDPEKDPEKEVLH